MKRQLDLPLGAAYRSELAEQGRVIRSHLDGCWPRLCALHVSPNLVLEILLRPHRYWRRVEKPKPNGGVRVCYDPAPVLRRIQLQLWAHLRLLDWNSHFPATAYAPGDSILANAAFHRSNRSSLLVDLVDAFFQIRTKHLFRRVLYLYQTSGRRFSPRVNNRDAAWIIARLLTFHGRLRQGSPTAQHVYNVMLRRFDLALASALTAPTSQDELHWINLGHLGVVKGYVYTRYGDDLCISSPDEEMNPEVIEQVKAVAVAHNLRINLRKLCQGSQGRLLLPGVMIDQGRVRPSRRYVDGLLAHVEATGPLPPEVVRGHRGFLKPFGRSGRLKILRPVLFANQNS